MPPRLVNFSMTFIAYFERKTLTILTLKCASHGGMYGGHINVEK